MLLLAHLNKHHSPKILALDLLAKVQLAYFSWHLFMHPLAAPQGHTSPPSGRELHPTAKRLWAPTFRGFHRLKWTSQRGIAQTRPKVL